MCVELSDVLTANKLLKGTDAEIMCERETKDGKVRVAMVTQCQAITGECQGGVQSALKQQQRKEY